MVRHMGNLRLGALAVGDVFREAEQILRFAPRIRDRQLGGAERALAAFR